MPYSIERDNARFRRIIKGKIRDDLKKFISNGELIGKKGKDWVKIPVPSINLPKLRFGKNVPGVGQGEGKEGSIIDQNGPQQEGGGGDQAGEHFLEVELSREELAEILGEALRLPLLQPKGSNRIMAEKDRYNQISKVGPESLRHFRRTFREALKRQIASGLYDPHNPYIVPIREDKRYLSWSVKQKPQRNALVIYAMDVSGSMSDDLKEIVRTEAFWIDTWMLLNYPGVMTEYVIHDVNAKKVDGEVFYHISESGGTHLSSAFEFCEKMIEKDYSPEMWNIYVFHFTDGDNSSDDNEAAVVALARLLPSLNLYCYGQVGAPNKASPFLSGLSGTPLFFDILKSKFEQEKEKIRLSRIYGKEAIMDSIKIFLG